MAEDKEVWCFEEGFLVFSAIRDNGQTYYARSSFR